MKTPTLNIVQCARNIGHEKAYKITKRYICNYTRLALINYRQLQTLKLIESMQRWWQIILI